MSDYMFLVYTTGHGMFRDIPEYLYTETMGSMAEAMGYAHTLACEDDAIWVDVHDMRSESWGFVRPWHSFGWQ